MSLFIFRTPHPTLFKVKGIRLSERRNVGNHCNSHCTPDVTAAEATMPESRRSTNPFSAPMKRRSFFAGMAAVSGTVLWSSASGKMASAQEQDDEPG